MNAALPGYAELHCLSNFSFLRGASHPEELAEQAIRRHYQALAITDECSFAGIVRAHGECKRAGFKLIIGTELQLHDGPRLVLLAQNRRGYAALCKLITQARMQADKGSYRLSVTELEQGLPDCLALLIPTGDADDQAHARWLAQRFAQRAWIAVELLCGPNDRAWLDRLRALGAESGLPLVAAGDVHMHARSRKPLQDVLTAIRLGRPVDACGHALFPNAERHLRSRLRLAQLYPAALLAETLRVASLCTFSLDELRYEYPHEIIPQGETAASYLRKEVERGLAERYPAGASEKILAQIEHELALIADKQYEPYFLTVYDIVKFAREQNILCQGRGSSANSAVCYALGITAVDPARSNMLFERFISHERDEPPDIDVDFEHDRREQVIQYIYAKYGRDRAALAATVIRYRRRSALRDVGKALGFNAEQIERVAKSIAWWERSTVLAERCAQAGIDPASLRARQLLYLVDTLSGFPRHLSQHVGGFVIARGLLSELVPIENAAMKDRSVIQWEKDDLETLGLMKIDVLALGMLSVIQRTLQLIGNTNAAPRCMQDIPDGDPAVFDMLCAADSVGVFQVESRAQMSMLPRLRPRCYYDLVVQIAIVRPGPIQGGMVHPYLAQRAKQRRGETIDMPYPALQPVLGRTLGVPIFQEQVMQLAMTAGGFSAGQADQLRRAMASWHKKGGLEKFEQALLAGMRERNYPEAFAQQIWNQIHGFGEYGFPESHSASFALLAYVSAWLKYHYPAAFLAGLLNSQPMGFYAPAQLVQDARRHHIEVRAVDVAFSARECTLESDAADVVKPAPSTSALQPASARPTLMQPAVRLGLSMVKNLSRAGIDRLLAARAAAPFKDLDDLAHRAALMQSDLRALATANAFGALSAHRRHALWQVAGIDPRPLLRGIAIDEAMPALEPLNEAQNICADYAHLGLTLGRHPLALLRPQLNKLRSLNAEALKQLRQGAQVAVSGLVTSRQRPGSGSTIFVTLEDETGNTNVIVWARVAEHQREALLGARLLTVQGRIERSDETLHLIARRLIDHSHLLGELAVRSRDFH